MPESRYCPVGRLLDFPSWRAIHRIIPGLIVALLPSAVFASSSYWGVFTARYSNFPATQGNNCYSLCHSYENYPGPSRPGSYYASWKAAVAARTNISNDYYGGLPPAAVDQAYVDIESMDSDGDGYTNLAEILAGTRPGDTTDHPSFTSPGAPTGVSAAGGNAQAIVSFTPGANGGSPVMNFTVTASPGGIRASGTSSPILVSGLTNGTPYTFTVTASNGLVTVTAGSTASNSVTPAGSATVPTLVNAKAGGAQATVTFLEPTNGSLVNGTAMGYTVTSSPGGITASGYGSPILVQGLTNDVTYTFTVAVTNSGLPSAASNTVTPSASLAVAPDAPNCCSFVDAGNSMAILSFDPPANGGSPITAYTAICTYSPVQGVTLSFSVTSPAPNILIAGLNNGTTYKCGLTATNAVGASAAPNPQIYPAQFTPSAPAPPSVPTTITATPGNGQVTIAFGPPAIDGGSAVLDYSASCKAGGTTVGPVTGTASPLTVTGLINGNTYTCWATARNAQGTFNSLAFHPNALSVTPAAITAPGAPTAVNAVAGDAKATVSFTPPASNGGSAVTAYAVTSSPDGITATGPISPIIVTDLANGTAYTFTVTAMNSVGSGPASAASSAATPSAAVVAAPDSPNCCSFVDAGNGMAILAFDPPANNGSPITVYSATCTYSLVQGVTLSLNASAPASPIILGGLTNGTIYQCKLTATNAVGTSPIPADPTVQFTPFIPAPPSTPTAITATAGNAQATISFGPPGNDGGSAVLDYSAYCKTGNTTIGPITGTASPLIVPGLTNGTPYACWVTARNAQGTFNSLAFHPITVSVTPAAITVTTTTTTTSTAATTTTTSTTTTSISSTTTTTLAGGGTANLVSGWNLLGNGMSNAINVVNTFGSATLVNTVWKWIASSTKWAFYTPTIGDGGSAYAASKGYDFLTTINAGEGFWVNAVSAFSVPLSGNPVAATLFKDQVGSSPLPMGWSLIAVGDNRTPVTFANAVSNAATPPSAGQAAASVVTLWAWDAEKSGWYFFEPNMYNAGTLPNYIGGKGYLNFFGTPSKALDPTTGFWVNHP